MAPKLICAIVKIPANSSENSLARGTLSVDEAVTFTGLRDSITSLFRASKVARYASKRDRFMEAQSRTFTDDDSNEDDLITQLGELFPRLRDPGLMWLRRRLVNACSMRLRYLSYCKSHQERIRLGGMNAAGEEISDEQSRATTASALGQQELDFALRDIGADGTESVLSYRTETRNDIRFKILELEELLEDSDKREHKCPYCQVPQLLDRSKSNDELIRLWKRHVYDDIKPYVCTDEKCTVKMFGDNRLWLKHQCSEHLARWGCPYCEDRDHFESYQDFEHHMRKQHSIDRDSDKLQRWAKISEIALTRVPMTACPLCDWAQFYTARRVTKGNHEKMVSDRQSVSLDRYRRHVGSHLEQIALGLLPEDYRDILGDESNESSEDEAAPASTVDTGQVKEKPAETEETDNERLAKEEEQWREAYLSMWPAEKEVPVPYITAKAAKADRKLERQMREAEARELMRQRYPNLRNSEPVDQHDDLEAKALFASLKKPSIGPGATENTEEVELEDERDRDFESHGDVDAGEAKATLTSPKDPIGSAPPSPKSYTALFARDLTGLQSDASEPEAFSHARAHDKSLAPPSLEIRDPHGRMIQMDEGLESVNPGYARALDDSVGGGSRHAVPGFKRPIPRRQYAKGERVMMEVMESRKRTFRSFVITDHKSTSDGKWVYKLATSEGPLYAGGSWFPEIYLHYE
jgi:hypothetical protein